MRRPTCRHRRPCLALLLSSTMVMLLSRPYWPETRTPPMPPLDPALAYDDPKLLQTVGRTFLHPPSTEPYNLMETLAESNVRAAQYLAYKGEFAYMFCQTVIKDIFSGVKNGFFVEAGALDGEFLSNTLRLEREHAWTGLLVEADGDMYKELLTKNRRAWTSHSCLATRQHPHTGTLIKYVRQRNLHDEFSNHAARAHGSLLGQTGGATLDGSAPGHPIYESVQCLPLASLLLTLNLTHVDLVSLDVEGAEVGVLQYFPWHRVTVDVWVVEHAAHTTHDPSSTTRVKDTSFVEFFTSRGYEVFRVSQDLVIPNYAFVRRGSAPHRTLRARHLNPLRPKT